MTERNMYGIKPCPKCGSPYRCVWEKSQKIECDDCGYKVAYTKNVEAMGFDDAEEDRETTR